MSTKLKGKSKVIPVDGGGEKKSEESDSEHLVDILVLDDGKGDDKKDGPEVDGPEEGRLNAT